ncbi:hypothetical protein AVEN_271110-1 [Araneus ventricosus]|uniref:Uncharacterized protein n=1 Tax=Araneus ventricosus TaxID=182803 RepID=A0A4Y2E7A3_ARAVE|nr:hypothetical protein AVEN_271110-1 [Araneus ventricosus]
MVRHRVDPLFNCFNRHQEPYCSTNTGNLIEIYKHFKLGEIRAHVGYSAGCTSQEGNTEGNSHIHPSAKKQYQEYASNTVHHPLAKRMGQWRNRQECLQRSA